MIRIVGRGTMRESTSVRDFSRTVMQQGTPVVLDLVPCDYLDSTFLGCLVVLKEFADKSPGSFAVVADEATKARLLKRFRLDRILTLVDACPACSGEPVTCQPADLTSPEFREHLFETHRKLAEVGGPAAAVMREIADQMAKELKSGLT